MKQTISEKFIVIFALVFEVYLSQICKCRENRNTF